VAPAIEDGAVAVVGNQIAAVGKYAALKSEFSGVTIDLGESVVLPGLVNAHCHLDYTDMTGLPAPRYFSDWIAGLVALKAGASYTEYAAAWLRGAAMLESSGTTTVADIEAVPELIPEVWSSTRLRVVSFLEMTGVKSKRDPGEILRDAAAKIDSLPQGRCSGGLSPHALYSTTPALLEASATYARERGLRLTTHLAESIDEANMYGKRSGPLFDWLKSQRDMEDCGGRTSVEQAARCGLLGGNFLAAHCNYITESDAALLSGNGASVVHCPRSHAYFGHAAFPYAALAKAKVNICLGTDSLASVTKSSVDGLELSMFAEMRQFAVANRGVPPEQILKMATASGAQALGRSRKIGELAPGALADIIALPASAKTRDVCESVVHDARRVSAAMIDGQWAIAPQ
jgi:cytosine/adenosine deaminase-related metal-dependent hydrolase